MSLHPGQEQRHVPEENRSELDFILRARRDSEDWYQDLVQHSDDLLCIHDLAGRLLSVNPAPARTLGYSVEELLKIPMREIVVPGYRSRFDAYLAAIEREREANGYLAVMTRSGAQRIWQYHNTLRTEGVASPIVRGIAHDVTEQKHTEKLLREAGEDLLARVRERERTILDLKLFRTLVDQCNDAIEVVDPDTLRFLDVNEKACSALGYSREEFLSLSVFDINPLVTESSVEKVREDLKKSGVLRAETYHRRKDGTTFPVEVSMRWVRLERDYVIIICRDLTESKKAEARLREYERLVEGLEEMIVVVNRDYRYVIANRAFLDYRGAEKDQVVGHRIDEVLNREALEAIKQKVDACFHGKVVEYEMKYTYPHLGERDLFITYFPIEGPAGVDRIAAILRDVTEKKCAQSALRRSEENYRMFVSQSSEGIFRQDLDEPVPIDLPEDELVHHILHDSYLAECNEAIVKMYGLNSVEEFVGKRMTETLDPKDPRNIELTRDYIRSGFRVLDRESHEMDTYGNPRVFLNSLIGIVENGKLVRTWGIQRDVTEKVKLEESHRRAEEALRESESHFRLLVEQASDGIFLADDQGRYIDVNSAGAEMLGYSRVEILRLSIADIVAAEEVARIPDEVARFAGGCVVRTEWKFQRKDGSFFSGELVGRQLPDGRLQGILRDITERRRVDEALRQSEQQFRVALDGSPIRVFNQDRTLRYTWVYNPQEGWSEQDYLGKTDEEIFDPETAARMTALKRPVLETGQGARQEFALTARGRTHYCDVTVEPLRDAAGAVVGVNCACVDVTHLRQLTEELREAKEKLSEEKLYLEHAIDTELGFGEIIGRSSALKEVMSKVGKVAPSDATVLLLGETGTGKELVARAIHRMSKRKDNSFIKLNCAAIPSGLLESELFGHEKGAFTGAVTKKLGRLELADHGTLFLDEIGEIPLELQPKLLRVLQDQEFERLGGTQTLKVNFRLLAATNRDLPENVKRQEFRSDLYYRLNVFPVQIPPLRERREDIPLLIEHFVRKCSARMNKSITRIPARTMETLVQWTWPGNIRELENFVERSVILTPGSVLQVPLSELIAPLDERNSDTLRDKDRERIIRALRECKGQLGGPDGAAARLGLKRTTLQSKLIHLGIDPGAYRA
ncbi:MAG: PAS domain S-box protein [Candidatus Sulfotelmatobacter sp.]